MSCLLAFCWGLNCTVYKAPVKVQLSGFFSLSMTSGREGKGREGKGRQGKGREGKGREGKERKGKDVYCITTNIMHRQDLPPWEPAFVTCICLRTYHKHCRHFDRYVQVAGVIAQPARQQEADLVFMLGLAATSCVCAIAQTGECGQSKHEDEVSFLLPGRLCNHTSHLYIPVKVPAALVVGSQANAGYKRSFLRGQILPGKERARKGRVRKEKARHMPLSRAARFLCRQLGVPWSQGGCCPILSEPGILCARTEGSF